MLQTKADGLTIADPDAEPDQHRSEPVQPQAEPQSHYENAREFDWSEYSYRVRRFINGVFDRLHKDQNAKNARLIDYVEPSKDIDDGFLAAYPDESLLFVGKDPTTTDHTFPWYAFTIEPMEPVPAPESARDALDLLKPPEVQSVIHEDDWIPNRHGEWWLLPTQMMPAGTVHTPGVQSTPYGPSPLGNHVPREYAFTLTDSEFMDKFSAQVDSAPSSIQTVPEAIDWSFRQLNKEIPPEDAPSWADIRNWAGDVLVKGTIRHRENDHYIENCEETWHKAVTHRMEVYTADDIGNVHLDYYGE